MFRITGIELTDFGRHKHLSQKIHGSIVGLSAPNGKGKTTVEQAVQFGITGTIDHEDPLSAFIRLDSTDKPPKNAQVTLHFEADGKPGRIHRKITASATTRELEWDGKKISSDKAVTATMFEILGVDKKAINSTVFIRQGEIGRMFGADIDRREFYTRLLMLGHLTKVADVIDVFRKQVSDSVKDLSAVRDGALETYNSSLEFRAQCDAELAEKPPGAAELAELSVLVSLFDVLARAELAFETAEGNRNALGDEESLGQAMDALAAEITLCEKLQSEMEDKQSKFNADSARIATLERNIHESSEVARLWALRGESEEELSKAKQTLETYANVGERIKASQQVVDLRKIEAALPAQIEEWRIKVANEDARLTKGVEEADAMRADLAAKQADAQACSARTGEIRTKIVDLNGEIARGTQLRNATAGFTSCPCCGSTAPDHTFLDRRIAELQEQVTTLTASITEIEQGRSATPGEMADLANRLQAFDSGIIKVRVSLGKLKEELAGKEAELMRTSIMLAGAATLAAAELELENLKAQDAARIAASADVTRVANGLTRIDTTINGRIKPNADILLEWNNELAKLRPLVTGVDAWGAANTAALSDLRKQLPAKRERLRSMEQADSSLAAARLAMSAAEAKLQKGLTKSLHLATLREIFTGRQLTAADVQSTAEQFTRRQSEHDAARGKLEAARRAVIAADTALQNLDNRIAAQEERRKLVADLVMLRDTFRPTGATMEYLDYEFGRIATMAADYLAESGADFMVAASENVPLAYEFLRLDRPDEVWMPQTRMSGGQRVRLAVATLRAIHALIMPNVGLMVLDEPTTHLDAAAKEAMAEMLRRIGSENTLQMIVCDHDPILIDAFDDEIKIPE